MAAIGRLVGFKLSAASNSAGSVVSTGVGTAYLDTGQRINYCASSASIGSGYFGKRARIFLTDDAFVEHATTPTQGPNCFPCPIWIDEDDTMARGIYPGGLIVLGFINVPIPELQANPDKPMDPRERTSLLRIIRALGVMANLKERGAATSIVAQLQQLGFDGPSESTIRKTLADARALDPD